MSTGRIYSVQFNAVSVAAQQDLFEINAASTGNAELLELHLGNNTAVGDASEKMLSILIKTGATTSGTGGTTPTAIPRMLGTTAFGGTVEANNTTKATAGTIVTHEAHNWNIRVPFARIWTPETTIIIQPSTRLTVELATTPSSSFTGCGVAIFRSWG